MEIRVNNSVVVGKRIDADAVGVAGRFALLKTSDVKEFVDGVATDKVIAQAYEVVDMIAFRHIRVKIDGQKKPLIADEVLQERRNTGEHVMVEFDGLTVLAYINNKTNSLEDSFKADEIHFVEVE